MAIQTVVPLGAGGTDWEGAGRDLQGTGHILDLGLGGAKCRVAL